MKEQVLVLAVAYPENSKKYHDLVCIAGVTIDGEWRRLYPITFGEYNGLDIHKRCWIEYQLSQKGNPDRRIESKKIEKGTLRVVDEEQEDYAVVHETVNAHVSDLEYLAEAYKQEWVSMGVVKPVLSGYQFKPNEDYIPTSTQQLDLDKNKAFEITKLEEKFQYSFKCGGDSCKGHTIVCIDIEAGELYRNCLAYPPEERREKIADKLYWWMRNERDLYFIVGTHSRFKSWLIVGLYYPKKDLSYVKQPLSYPKRVKQFQLNGS